MHAVQRTAFLLVKVILFANRPGGRLPVPDLPNTKTSIDLELDLAAQQSKLTVLNEEIDRLRQIKSKMEEARDNGNSELPAWFHEDEKFQALLASVSS